MSSANGLAIRDTVCAVIVRVAIGAGAVWCLHGCAIWQHEEARSAAEMGCVERFKTTPQIEACREIVNGITSKYADAGEE